MAQDTTNNGSPRTVVVTGAGSGIGRAIARGLLAAGCDLVIGGRRETPLRELEAEGRAAGREVSVHALDLGSRPKQDAFVSAVVARGTTLHGVVLNAATNGKTPLGGDSRAFDEQVEVNLLASYRLLRGLLPHLEDGARLVAIASVLAKVGIPDYHGYCATKSGLVGLMRALALELAPRGISCVSVLPGWTETAMAERSMAEQAPDLGLDPAGARRHFLAGVPLGRMLHPEEVADLVLHLFGPSGAAFTGQALTIDGGSLA